MSSAKIKSWTLTDWATQVALNNLISFFSISHQDLKWPQTLKTECWPTLQHADLLFKGLMSQSSKRENVKHSAARTFFLLEWCLLRVHHLISPMASTQAWGIPQGVPLDCHSLMLQEGCPVAQPQDSLGQSPWGCYWTVCLRSALSFVWQEKIGSSLSGKVRSGDEGKEEARSWPLGTGTSQQRALSSYRSLDKPRFYFTGSYWAPDVCRPARSCRSE